MVTSTFPRWEGDVAGAPLWRLVQALVLRDHAITVIAPSDRGETGEQLLGAVQVRRIRYAPAGLETLAYQDGGRIMPGGLVRTTLFGRLVWAMASATRREALKSGASVIHAHGVLPAGLAARLTDRAGRRFIVSLYGQDASMARLVPGGRRFTRWVLRSAHVISAVNGDAAAAGADALGRPRNEFAVLPLPVALGVTAHPDSARSGAVFVGNLIKEHRVANLLDALASLRRQGKSFDLTVVGEGPERAALKAQAIALGLTVTFTGYVAPDQVSEHLWDKRVFIQPAPQREGVVIVAEALINGVPVVVPRQGGAADVLVDANAGMMVADAEPAALAAAIREVAGDERYRVGAFRAGRVLSDRMSPEKVAEQFELLYSRARTSRLRVSAPAT